jgi:VIT1/CCC1 family predicted Fe2+/Mn2+ transporter
LKRIYWAFGVGPGGFYIGGMGGGPLGGALGFVWGACIGYSFGSIFDTKQATKWVVVYWIVALGLIGTFFGLVVGAPPEPSIAKETLIGARGAGAGAAVGFLIGIIQL